jgi:hypothetical protein
MTATVTIEIGRERNLAGTLAGLLGLLQTSASAANRP